MEYLEFRRLLASDPNHPDPEFQRLKRDDERCAAAAARAAEFDEKLLRALQVPAPEGLADRIILSQTTPAISRRRRQQWSWALAAAITLGIALGVVFKLREPAPDLSRSVIAHVMHEPSALLAQEPIDASVVSAHFGAFGSSLEGEIGIVTYVKRCPMPQGDGVHLVVRSETGPVTLFYMPGQQLAAAQPVTGQGVSGMLMPLPIGSFAVIGGSDEDRDALSESFLRNLIQNPGGDALSFVSG